MPKPQYKTQVKSYQLFLADCLKKLKELPENSVDSIVTDPPYGLKFMSKKWDYTIPGIEVWRECLRVLKPGGFLLSFGGCRTYHRLVCNIEDAGFRIHPMVAWLFGQGFPKAANLGKQIDKAAKKEREVAGTGQYAARRPRPTKETCNPDAEYRMGAGHDITAPATDAAKQWDGWFYGLQALKPAIEPICMAQKPYDGKPVDSILKWGCGAINVNRCRIGMEIMDTPAGPTGKSGIYNSRERMQKAIPKTGRWPANLILSHHPECVRVGVKRINTGIAGSGETGEIEIWECVEGCPVGMFPKTKTHGGGKATYGGTFGSGAAVTDTTAMERFKSDSGSAARFFYCAKASKRDRNEGLEGFEEKNLAGHNKWTDCDYRRGDGEVTNKKQSNHHPTVKPTDLMRYLCRLITPPGGIVLDPFMGSGSTGKACMLEGFRFIGIEIGYEYFKIARERIKHAYAQSK